MSGSLWKVVAFTIAEAHCPGVRGIGRVAGRLILVTDSGVADPQFVARQIVQLMEGAITTAMFERDPTAADVVRASAAEILTAGARTNQHA